MRTAIYTVVKDEVEYINDFILYHLNLGIDQIFIFEDVGSQSHKSICDQYPNVTLKPILDLFNDEERGDIIRKKAYGKFVQSDYAHTGLMWIKNTYPDIDWCFSLDCDEYITPTEPFPSLLERYNDYDAITLYWKNYGASGHIKKPIYDKPIWEIYTQECPYKESDKQRAVITKMVYNMHKLQDKFIWGVHTALCNWVRTDFGVHRTDEPCFDVMYLRHYITKSWEEWCWKLKTRGMFCKNNRKVEDFFIFNPDMDKDLLLKEETLYL